MSKNTAQFEEFPQLYLCEHMYTQSITIFGGGNRRISTAAYFPITLPGKDLDQYRNHWIYHCFGKNSVFEKSEPKNIDWVSKLYTKIKNQINDFIPRNHETVKQIFPNFVKLLPIIQFG